MSQSKDKKVMAVALALGSEFIALVLVGIYVGNHIEKYLRGGVTTNRGALVGCALAFFIWFWRLMKTKRHMF